jgi:hypothetical protein
MSKKTNDIKLFYGVKFILTYFAIFLFLSNKSYADRPLCYHHCLKLIGESVMDGYVEEKECEHLTLPSQCKKILCSGYFDYDYDQLKECMARD